MNDTTPMTHAWTNRHGDGRNSDFLDIEGHASFQVKWQALKNTPAATVACHNGDDRIYALTLNTATKQQGVLWCFNLDGECLWHSGDQVKPSLTSHCLDSMGNILVADGSRITSWTPSGELRWHTDWPHETSGLMPIGTKGILCLGIDGMYAVFHSECGRLLSDPMQLPGRPMIDGVNHAHLKNRYDAMLDNVVQLGVCPDYAPKALNRFFGKQVLAKNVPAIDHDTNRLYIASAIDEESSRLSAFSIEEKCGRFSITPVYKTVLGAGCDTSPAISFDTHAIYLSDKEGWHYSIDAHTGVVNWRNQLPDTSSASPNTAPDGRIYTSIKSAVICHAADGTLEWSNTFADSFDSDNQVNSVLVVTRQFIYAVLTTLAAPKQHYFIVLDRLNGQLISTVDLPHESLCTPSIMPDGSVLIPSKPFFHERDTRDFYGLCCLTPTTD